MILLSTITNTAGRKTAERRGSVSVPGGIDHHHSYKNEEEDEKEEKCTTEIVHKLKREE